LGAVILRLKLGEQEVAEPDHEALRVERGHPLELDFLDIIEAPLRPPRQITNFF
jgi:hypothetical protein